MFNDTSAVDRVRRGATSSSSDTGKLVNMDVWYATTLWLALLSGWIDPTSGRRTRNNPGGGVLVKPVVPPALLVPPASGEDGYYDSGHPAGGSLHYDDYPMTGLPSVRSPRSADPFYGEPEPYEGRQREYRPPMPIPREGPPIQTMPFPLQTLGGSGGFPMPYGSEGGFPDSGGKMNTGDFGQIPAISLFPAQGQRPGSRKNKKASVNMAFPPVQQSGDVWDELWEGGNEKPRKSGKFRGGNGPSRKAELPQSPPEMSAAFGDMSPFASLPYQSMTPPRRRHGAWSPSAVGGPPMDAMQDGIDDAQRMKRRSRKRGHSRGNPGVTLQGVNNGKIAQPIKLRTLPGGPRNLSADTSDEPHSRGSMRSEPRREGGRRPLNTATRADSSSEEDSESVESHKSHRRSRRPGGHKRRRIYDDDDDSEEEDRPRRLRHTRRARAMHSSERGSDAREFPARRRRRRQRGSKAEEYGDQYSDGIEDA